MIPFFRYTTIPLGPLHIQVWGLLVVIGICAALYVGCGEARRRKLLTDVFLDFATWALLGAFIGARLMYLAYNPALLANPLAILKFWEGGESSIGGMVGSAIGAWLFARRRKIDFLEYADVAAFIFPLGYAIGRIGCFLIHDHPGMPSTLFFAVRYPDTPRLDLGLLHSLFGFALMAAFARARAIYKPLGSFFLPRLMLIYGAVRFFMDFLRAWDAPYAETRYYGLTPAQYACIALVAVGAWWLAKIRTTQQASR